MVLVMKTSQMYLVDGKFVWLQKRRGDRGAVVVHVVEEQREEGRAGREEG